MRISAFITYATNDTICRSRQLLAYFGEERSEDCGHCDVCIDARHHTPTADDDAVKKILQLLSDKGVHTLKEVYQMDAGTTALDRALRFLISEEKVKADADKLTIA